MTIVHSRYSIHKHTPVEQLNYPFLSFFLPFLSTSGHLRCELRMKMGSGQGGRKTEMKYYHYMECADLLAGNNNKYK